MFWQKSIACSIVMSMPFFHTSFFAAAAAFVVTIDHQPPLSDVCLLAFELAHDIPAES
jgi:hypothetical protein